MKQAWDHIRAEIIVKFIKMCGIRKALSGAEDDAFLMTMIVVLKMSISVLI